MTRKTWHSYVAFRIIQLMTGTLYIAFGSFFRLRIHQTLSEMCPQGKFSAIGGKQKRNILSLGITIIPSFHHVLLSIQAKIFPDLCNYINIDHSS